MEYEKKEEKSNDAVIQYLQADTTISAEKQNELLRQVKKEFKVADDILKNKRERGMKKLKLYMNLKREEEKTGDPLMFSVFNTILASLYDDRMSVEFTGRDKKGDIIQEEHVNGLAESDYETMRKDIHDYEWDWDTLFFGKGYSLMAGFNPDTKTPVAEICDPLNFYYDPSGTSANGNGMGHNAYRFFGRKVTLTRREINNGDNYINKEVFLKQAVKAKNDPVSDARRELQGLTVTYSDEELEMGDNTNYSVVQHWTWYDGKRCLVMCDEDFNIMLGYQELKFNVWPLVERVIYPMAHSAEGISITDILEDKQRARAILQNASIEGVRLALYGFTVYDKRVIKNPKDVVPESRKAIGVEANPSDVIKTNRPTSPDLNAVVGMMNLLDTSAQKATATPDLQQGTTSKDQRTLGELNLIASKVDTRYSLSLKIFGWSEREWYRMWFLFYKTYFVTELGSKTIRISGAYGDITREIPADTIKRLVDLDITVSSKILKEAERMRELRDYGRALQFIMQDPNTNRRYAIRKYLRLSGMPSDEIERLYPKNVEEYQAEWENELLRKGKLPKIEANDDHRAHIEIHMQLNATKEVVAHIISHREALRLQFKRPELFPNLQQQQTQEQSITQQAGQQAGATATTLQQQLQSPSQQATTDNMLGQA